MFFRSETIGDSFDYLYRMIFNFNINLSYKSGILYVISILILDYILRNNERIEYKYFRYEWIITSVLIVLILEKCGNYSEFIYFQF